MTASRETTAQTLQVAVEAYRDGGDFAALHLKLESLCRESDLDELVDAAEPYLNVPEVAGPVYEYIVARRPEDARALVVLASSYWLAGRGPDVVGELASRALSVDPENRGAWHLWALTESDPRSRMERWLQVSTRFPSDDLARANLADGAASVASAENDPVALSIAMDAFETLLSTANNPEQREAVSRALETLKSWRM